MGPYVQPSANEEPPPLPVQKPGGEAQSQTGKDGKQTEDKAGKQAEQEIDEDEVVRINASEVLLPVTVRDASGALVTNLGRKDFKVYEDGREQPLSDISLRQVPVDVALLVDASSSVAESFEDFRRAAEEFAGRVSPEDRFCLVKFDDRVELLLDWSKSRLQLRRALGRLTTGVFTRFNDALLLSAREQFQPGERRRALVFLSDGIDSNRGSATAEAAQRALLETQVTVYGIANTEIERMRKRSELDNLLNGTDSSVRFNQLRIGDLQESLRVLDAERAQPRSPDALDRRTSLPPAELPRARARLLRDSRRAAPPVRSLLHADQPHARRTLPPRPRRGLGARLRSLHTRRLLRPAPLEGSRRSRATARSPRSNLRTPSHQFEQQSRISRLPAAPRNVLPRTDISD